MSKKQIKKDLQPIPFSAKKKKLADVMAYVGILMAIVLFFSPILGLRETKDIHGKSFTFTAACSPFQFLIDETVADVHVFGGTKDEKEFLDAFTSSIDVAEDTSGILPFLLYEHGHWLLSIAVTIFLAIIYVYVPVMSFLNKRKLNIKKYKFTSDSLHEEILLRDIQEKYFDYIYGRKKAQTIYMIIAYPILITTLFCVVSFAFGTTSMFRPNIDIVRLIIAGIIVIISFKLCLGRTPILRKEAWAIIIDNYILDERLHVLRPRTEEETNNLLSIIDPEKVTTTSISMTQEFFDRLNSATVNSDL